MKFFFFPLLNLNSSLSFSCPLPALFPALSGKKRKKRQRIWVEMKIYCKKTALKNASSDNNNANSNRI